MSDITPDQVPPWEDLPEKEEESSDDSVLMANIAFAEAALEKQGGITLSKYGFGAWSPSKIKLLIKCPYQFYLKYVLKVKNDSYVQDRSMADIGTVAHRILEHLVQGRTITEAYAITKIEHCNLPAGTPPGTANLTEQQWEESIIPLEFNINAFKERLDAFQRDNKVVSINTELKLGVTKDWKKTSFFAKDVYFRGIIDLLILIDQGPAFYPDGLIIDHKHGGAEGDQKGSTRNYQDQLDAYKPLIHFGMTKLSGASAGIHFIKAGKTAYDDYTDTEGIENKLRKSVEWSIDCAVSNVEELGFFKHVRGNHCKYCEFDVPCKAKKLKENELSTKKWFEIKEIK